MARFPIVYDRATSPTQGPAPGARALMAWALAWEPTATNLGIYNNRSVRGGKSLSTHAEGRGIDIGLPATHGGTKPGWALAHLLEQHSADLGIQQLIYARKIWRNTRADAGWRKYTGSSAHNEHIHCELTRQAARELTPEMIDDTIGDLMALEAAMKRHQEWLNTFHLGDPLTIDGDRGPITIAMEQRIADTFHARGNALIQNEKTLDTAADRIDDLERMLDEAVSEPTELDAQVAAKASAYDALADLLGAAVHSREVVTPG